MSAAFATVDQGATLHSEYEEAQALDLSELGRVASELVLGMDSEIYRPIFFTNSHYHLREIEGMSGAAGLEVRDVLHRQIEELARIRRPRIQMKPEALATEVDALLQGMPIVRAGLWVFYPWCKRIVHTVSREYFIELRTDRNLYKITRQERDALGSKRVGIVGLSVGQAVALTMATERVCGELRLADFDTLDATNLNRLRAGVADLGLCKAVIAARQIAELDPYLLVRCFMQGISESNVDDFLLGDAPLDLVAEECDSLDVKFLVRERARKYRIPVLMETSDRGMLDVERFDREPTRAPFHGLAGGSSYGCMANQSFEQKLTLGLAITGVETLSMRARASLMEVRQSIASWPQLASAVALGGASVTDTARRILLGEAVNSGRYYIDLHALISPKLTPSAAGGKSNQTPTLSCVRPASHPHQHADVLSQLSGDKQAVDLDTQTLHALVRAGLSAPSGGNSQPCRWAYGHNTLLLLSHGWGQEILDFRGVASCAAAGAALENVLLEAQRHGLHARVHEFPDKNDPHCVAAIRFVPSATSADVKLSWDPLAAQIFARHTNRRVGQRTPLGTAVIQRIEQAVSSIEGALFDIVTSENELNELGRVLGACQRILMQHPAGFKQVMGEILWDAQGDDSERGIPVDTLELSAMEQMGLRLCRDWETIAFDRDIGGGAALEASVLRAVQAASALCLVSVESEDYCGYLSGGRAMQRAWLAATAAGLAVQPLSPLPYLLARLEAGDPGGVLGHSGKHLVELGTRYRRLFPHAVDHKGVLLFRLAVAPPTRARSPRQDLEKVLHRF